jgi:hypothetical protein
VVGVAEGWSINTVPTRRPRKPRWGWGIRNVPESSKGTEEIKEQQQRDKKKHQQRGTKRRSSMKQRRDNGGQLKSKRINQEG